MHLVLRVVKPIGTLCTVGVRALLESVRADGEADRDDRVAGFEYVATPSPRHYGRRPRLYEVVDEGIVSPFRNLVAERMDVLERPVSTAIRPGEEPRRGPRGPRKSLDRLVAVPVHRAPSCGRMGRCRAGTVEANHAAVERIGADEVDDIIREEDREVGGVDVAWAVEQVLCP